MNFLTRSQKLWMMSRTIKVGKFYMFPRFGFNIYTEPFGQRQSVDTNPFFKSLDGQYFEVKEIRDGFVRGNFLERPISKDYWIHEDELTMRPMVVSGILFLVCFIPLVIYNLFNRKGLDQSIANGKEQ